MILQQNWFAAVDESYLFPCKGSAVPTEPSKVQGALLELVTVADNTDMYAACLGLPQHLLRAACCCVAAPGAVEMPPGASEWLTDEQQRGLQGWWARSKGPGGSYVVPAVLLTGVALTGVAAFVFMRRRRML
jgi:hypothetical protein